MQTLKRKWQNFKAHRQLQELWQDYKSKCQSSANPPTSKPEEFQTLLDFLESLKTAIEQIENSSGRETQIDDIFGDVDELLNILLSLLKDSDILRPIGGSLLNVFKILEFLSRSVRFKQNFSCEEFNWVVLSSIEKPESDEILISILKVLQNFSLSSKREACRSGLILKVLHLLMSKNEEIVKETMSTIKYFIESTAIDENNKSFRKKLSRVLGGVTKFAWSFFPSEDSSRSVEKYSEETEDQTVFPPPESALRQASIHFQKKFSAVDEVEQAISAGNSPVKLELKAEVVVEEFLTMKGTVTIIAKALVTASDWVKLELVSLLSILICNNVPNQKEFKKVDGYHVLAQCFNHIDVSNEEGRVILENCFKVLGSILISGKDSKEIGNIAAFKMLLYMAASSNGPLVVKNSVSLLNTLINDNWENVVCLYEFAFDYLTPVLEKNSIGLSSVKNNQLEETFVVIDETFKYISFLLGNAWERNVDILKVYSNVVDKHAKTLELEVLGRLVSSLCGIVGDINVRCNQKNSLVRSTFLSCFEGMKFAANASLSVLGVNLELALPLIANLLQFELLYTETLLSTPLSQDSINTLYPIALMDQFSKLKQISQIGFWVFEKYIVTKCGCEGVESELFKLIENEELLLVIKILMMEEYPNIDRIRAIKIRESFLNDQGLKVIKEGLPSIEYFWLMIAASKNSPELKNLLSLNIDLRSLSLQIPATMDYFNIFIELATIGGYLEVSDYCSLISTSLPSSSNDQILQVTHPQFLFTPISLSRRSSTATSTIHILDKSNLLEISISSCKFVCSNYIPAILILLSRSSADLQQEILKRLRYLSKTYHNKQVLCQMQFSKILMQLFDDLSPSSHPLCYSILKNLLSYSVSQEEASLLMDALSSTSIQSLLLDTLSINLHSSFYFLENQCLDTPAITSFPKSGYTLIFWVKFSIVSSEQTPIFSWVDYNRGLVLFKLSTFQSGEKKASGVDYLKAAMAPEPSQYLVIQAPVQPVFPSPDETAKFLVTGINGWTHVAIVHSKAGVNLYINGKSLGIVTCTHFANIKEKYNVKGVFGNKASKVMISGVAFIEGSLEAGLVAANYEKETVENCMFRMPDGTGQAVTSNVNLDDERWDLERVQIGNYFHRTSTIKVVLGKISAISQFLALLKTSMQPVALKCICDCITQNQLNFKSFIENGGWSFLAGILVKHEEFVSGESLEYLISAVLNKSRFHMKLKKMLVIKSDKIPNIPSDRVEGLSVLSELLAALPAKHVSGVLDCLTKLMYLDENAKLFLSGEVGGLMIIFDLLNSLIKDSTNEYLVLTLFEKILPFFNQEHVEMLLDYLASPELKTHFVKIENTIESVISIFSIYFYAGNTSLVDKFMISEGNLLLFDIARSPSEVIRCAAVKLIGLLLGISSKFKSWFLKTKGFDLLNLILQKQKPSKALYELVMNLAFNSFNNISFLYPGDSATVKMIINVSEIAAKALPANKVSPSDKKLVYVEAIEILIEILKNDSEENNKIEIFTAIENFLDSENCERLLESPFLVWTSNLVKDSQHLSLTGKENKNSQIFDTFLVKLCLFDLNRQTNKFKFIHWINKIPDSDSFKEKCLMSLLNKIKTNPNFDSCEGYIQNKSNFISNFYALLQSCELTISYSEMNMKVIHFINLLASCNTPAVRQQLKAVGFFDLRDDLMIQLLKEDLPQTVLIEGIQCFSFETIASQPKFRDSNAVIYFIKFLIEFHSAPALQLEILNLIQKDICINEDNRKYLRKILDNKFFLDFLSGFKGGETNTIAQCFNSMRNLKLDEENSAIPENPTAQDFLAWLNTAEKAKKTILAQVNKHLAPVDSEYRKIYNKSIEAKAIKRKKNTDALIKEKTSVQKQVNELELKLIARVAKADERCTHRFQAHSSVKSQKLSSGTRQSL